MRVSLISTKIDKNEFEFEIIDVIIPSGFVAEDSREQRSLSLQKFKKTT